MNQETVAAIRSQARKDLVAWWGRAIVEPLHALHRQLIADGMSEEQASAVVQDVYEETVMRPTRGLRGGL